MSEKSDTNPTNQADVQADVQAAAPMKKVNEKVTCRCGRTVSKKQYNGHLNSGLHIKAMKELVDKNIETKVVKDTGAKLTILQMLINMNKKMDHLVELNEDLTNAFLENSSEDSDAMDIDDIPSKKSKETPKKITTKRSK